MGSNGADLPLFSIDVAGAGDRGTTISVAGELDIATVDAFSQAVREAIAKGGVTIDLRKVTFMDSSGVRALNTALRESDENGRELWVTKRMHPSVVQVLEMTGMLELLPLEDAQ